MADSTPPLRHAYLAWVESPAGRRVTSRIRGYRHSWRAKQRVERAWLRRQGIVA